MLNTCSPLTPQPLTPIICYLQKEVSSFLPLYLAVFLRTCYKAQPLRYLYFGVHVANHKSTLKRMRQNATLRTHHRHYRSVMRSQIKTLLSAIEAGDKDLAKAELNKTTSVIQSLSTKGILHSNQAARRVSRLTKAVNRI